MLFPTLALAQPSILLYSRTLAFRHDSIPAAIQAITDLGSANNSWAVQSTEDPTVFTDAGLSNYTAVVFLST